MSSGSLSATSICASSEDLTYLPYGITFGEQESTRAARSFSPVTNQATSNVALNGNELNRSGVNPIRHESLFISANPGTSYNNNVTFNHSHTIAPPPNVYFNVVGTSTSSTSNGTVFLLPANVPSTSQSQIHGRTSSVHVSRQNSQIQTLLNSKPNPLPGQIHRPLLTASPNFTAIKQSPLRFSTLVSQKHEMTLPGSQGSQFTVQNEALRTSILNSSNLHVNPANAKPELLAFSTTSFTTNERALCINKEERYQRKHQLLKKSVKSLVLKNAALCDEVSRLNQRIQSVGDERRILLRKLTLHEKAKEKRLAKKSKPTSSNCTLNAKGVNLNDNTIKLETCAVALSTDEASSSSGLIDRKCSSDQFSSANNHAILDQLLQPANETLCQTKRIDLNNSMSSLSNETGTSSQHVNNSNIVVQYDHSFERITNSHL